MARRTLKDGFTDLLGIDYGKLTHRFAPEFIRSVARWPQLAILPAGGPSSHPDGERYLASLLRRDLSLAGAISLADGDEVGAHGSAADLLAEPARLVDFPWSRFASLECRARGSRLTVTFRLFLLGRDELPAEVAVEGEALPQLTVELTSRAATSLGLEPSTEARQRWLAGRPPSLKALEWTSEAVRREDGAALEAALKEGRTWPDAIVAGDLQGDGRRTCLERAGAMEPYNAWLAFANALSSWRGDGRRDSCTARTLGDGLAGGLGCGKCHMVYAHMAERTPWNAAPSLAHGEAGWRLLPGNGFAMTNYANLLLEFGVLDHRLDELEPELLDLAHRSPSATRAAMTVQLARERYDAAVALAERFVEMASGEQAAEVEYTFRQNPVVARGIDDGTFSPLEEARRLLEVCRKHRDGN